MTRPKLTIVAPAPKPPSAYVTVSPDAKHAALKLKSRADRVAQALCGQFATRAARNTAIGYLRELLRDGPALLAALEAER